MIIKRENGKSEAPKSLRVWVCVEKRLRDSSFAFLKHFLYRLCRALNIHAIDVNWNDQIVYSSFVVIQEPLKRLSMLSVEAPRQNALINEQLPSLIFW